VSVLTRSKPVAVSDPGAPAALPVAVPGRLGPPRWLGAVVLGGTVASFVVSATRPKNVPPAAQKVADTTTAVVLSMHPLEAAAMRRYAKKRGVAPSTRRRATFATLVYGVFGTVPARRKIRKATG
jgi:hypothetical protein